MKELPDTVVIVGAGPSGLFAARQLKMLATEQKKEISIIVLEREDVVGGKCRTYSDPENHELKTEWGAALLAPNYGVVLDQLCLNRFFKFNYSCYAQLTLTSHIF
ncbi:NAD(P)-binding protein [Legionella israelensis]|uniref:Protoporphyrinogen oxidase n=1 Tax=Legionella israelensis TaxID=454 RepID=A0A0W0WNY6_9GAMM|nr:FAD/NAD(P)-binding protein [Legionella israelensis]KTD34042.1 protoporphyrinogen oxidase [Legionella israelensis]QBS10625.1 NAD(P)/FAD-dependent oxidoreductase [Legionella israelensis]SCX85128.1 NAD(P)-binding Rossmann-like domain-containing protein [Legionella israelensis DSM 19235]STX57577.1 protoporphyrinogen oxidase [Legionella israelensis]